MDCEVVENTVLGKSFLYCRTHREEIPEIGYCLSAIDKDIEEQLKFDFPIAQTAEEAPHPLDGLTKEEAYELWKGLPTSSDDFFYD